MFHGPTTKVISSLIINEFCKRMIHCALCDKSWAYPPPFPFFGRPFSPINTNKKRSGSRTPPFRFNSTSSFLRLIPVLFFLSFSFSTSTCRSSFVLAKPKVLKKVYVTCYWKGEDPDTSRLRSSSGRRLVSGRSMASDPRVFDYGTKLVVGNREWVVVDTGTDVIAKKASRANGHRGVPVVDCFFNTEREAMRFLHALPSKCLYAEIK